MLINRKCYCVSTHNMTLKWIHVKLIKHSATIKLNTSATEIFFISWMMNPVSECYFSQQHENVHRIHCQKNDVTVGKHQSIIVQDMMWIEAKSVYHWPAWQRLTSLVFTRVLDYLWSASQVNRAGWVSRKIREESRSKMCSYSIFSEARMLRTKPVPTEFNSQLWLKQTYWSDN